MNEITHEEVEIFLKEVSFDLNPSQKTISFPKIKRIHKRLQEGKREKFNPIKVSDDVIIEGHHRYICYSILGMEIEIIPGGKNHHDNEELEWKNMVLDSKDHDTPAQIREHTKFFD